MVTKELILHFLDSWKHTDFYRCDYYCLPESEQTLFHNSAAVEKEEVLNYGFLQKLMLKAVGEEV